MCICVFDSIDDLCTCALCALFSYVCSLAFADEQTVQVYACTYTFLSLCVLAVPFSFPTDHSNRPNRPSHQQAPNRPSTNSTSIASTDQREPSLGHVFRYHPEHVRTQPALMPWLPTPSSFCNRQGNPTPRRR